MPQVPSASPQRDGEGFRRADGKEGNSALKLQLKEAYGPTDVEIARSPEKQASVSWQQRQSRVTLGNFQINTELRPQVMETCRAPVTLEEIYSS